MKLSALSVGSIGTNCFLVWDEAVKRCAVIDPGGDADRVIRAIADTGCTPECILLTHGHFDHVGAVEDLRAKYPGIPVWLNRRDIYDTEDRRITQIFPHLSAPLNNYDEGDTVSVGGLTFTVLATPGHTQGSVTLRCGDALFCGDTLFASSCGRTDFYGGDQEQMMASLARLGRLEGNLRVYPGHMEATDLDTERKSNLFLCQALEQA